MLDYYALIDGTDSVTRIDCISHIEQEHTHRLELCNELSVWECGFGVRLGNEAYEQVDCLI